MLNILNFICQFVQGYVEDTMWPHTHSLVFLHPTFRRKLGAVERGVAY